MFSRFKIVLPLLVLGAGFGGLLPTSTRNNSAPTPFEKPTTTSSSRLNQEEMDAIYETVLLNAVRSWKSLTPEEPVFVGIAGKNPSPRFIGRMKRRGLHVVGMSKSPLPYGMGRGAHSQLKHPQFSFGPIQPLGSGKFQVASDAVGGGSVLILQHQHGVWKITLGEGGWIS